MVKKSTITTSTTPVRTLFSRSATMMRMSFDWSARKVTSTPGGQVTSRRSTSVFSRSVSSMMFEPERFCTDSDTDSRPSMRE